MVEYLCIIQARLNSTRLPAKVMLDLAGKTLLERVYESVSKSKRINQIVVATSDMPTDDIIELKLKELDINCHRGNLNNVLERFYTAAVKYKAKNIIRVTADNPLMDGFIIDKLINLYESKDCDYSMFENGVYGLSAEIFTFNSLKLASINARDKFDKEHVTPYIKDNCKVYNENIELTYQLPNLSATVDTLDDYVKMNKFYMNCKIKNHEPTIDTFVIKEDINVK